MCVCAKIEQWGNAVSTPQSTPQGIQQASGVLGGRPGIFPPPNIIILSVVDRNRITCTRIIQL